MNYEDKTKEQLINELTELQKRVAELEASKTECNFAEEMLRKNENKYKTLLENLPQKIFHKDKNSVYVSCNDNYSRDLKINPDEIIGKTDYDFYPKELAEKYRADDKRIIESGDTKTVDEKYIQDGKEVIVRTVKTPAKNERGNIVGILGIFWDITEHKQAEEEIRKFKTIADRANYGVAISNLAGDLTYINECFADMHGYAVDQLIGRNISIFHNEDQMKRVEKLNKQLVQTGSFVAEEVWHIRKDKTSFPTLMSAMVIKDEDDKPIFLSATAIDITDLHQAEEEIRKTKDYLNNIIESSLDCIVVSDSAGYITRVNGYFLKLLDYEKEEVIGEMMNKFSPLKEGIYESITGEFVEIDKGYLNEISTAVSRFHRDGKISNWEIYFIRKDEKVIPIDVNIVFLFNKEGDRIGSVGILRDITERKKTEKDIKEGKYFLENVIESSMDGIAIVDVKGHIISVNSALLKMCKFSKEKLVGKHISILTIKDKDIRENILKNQGELFEKGFASYESKHAVSGENYIDVECNVSFVKDDEGNNIAGIAIIRDITERKKIEKQIEEAREFLENIYKTSLDGIMVTDQHGCITMVNKATEKMLRYSKDELLGKYTKELSPKGINNEEQTKEFLSELFGKGILAGFEHSWLKKDGGSIDIDTSIALLKDEEGNVTGAVGGIRDITERKKAEEALNKVNECLLNFGPNADDNIKKIVETAGSVLKGVCALYNKEEGPLLSTEKGWNIPRYFRKKDKKGGHICYDVIKKHGDKPFTINNLDKSPYAKTDRNITKYKLKTYIGSGVKMSNKAIGSLCVVYHNNKTFNSNELNILSILAKALGIEEERKKTLEELKNHQHMLEVSERSIKEFSRKMLSVREEEKRDLSHSLHDELGSMSIVLGSNLSILKEEIKDNNPQEALNRINQTRNALVQSVERLKLISKNLRPLDLDIIGLPNVLRQYLSDMRKQTKIKIAFRGNIDEQIIDDELAIVLYRVTQEAINNILKHARAKKVKVSLYSNENNITLTISDDGRGFDLQRMLKNTKGLGIRGMKERVEYLGGTLIIKSAVQKGTEICTTIPTKQQRGV